MQSLCDTRAVKILKYLRRKVPQTIPAASLNALEELPSSLLAGLHVTSDWDTVTRDAQLKSWLAHNPIPSPQAKASGPLFHGTLVFVQLIFHEPHQRPSSVSTADVRTALNYATLAVQPIQRYASQYGPNSVSISPNIISFPVHLTGNAFTQAELEGWVEKCATTARKDQINSPCIVILHNRDLPGSPAFTRNPNPYHSITADGTPYCYCLVFGENLSVADNNHTISGVNNEKVYAHILSHEITEMVVDPLANLGNPEVCDGCATNCGIVLFNLFDQDGVFLGGTASTASATGFAFFINPVVSSSAALDSNQCVVPAGDVQNACVYPPPFVTGELLSYGDSGTPGNVSNPMVVGFGGWSPFKFLFAGRNAAGQDCLYAVNAEGQLLSYQDAGTQGNVSNPVVVGFGGWLAFNFLFAGRNAAGQDRIYAVDPSGQLLSYGDSGTPGNVSAPVVVGLGGWSSFKFLFAGRNAAGEGRIYAVDPSGQLLSYGDSGAPGNVSAPVVVGFGGWSSFKFLCAGANAAGQDRIYAVAA
jgi:hypothetical protein